MIIARQRLLFTTPLATLVDAADFTLMREKVKIHRADYSALKRAYPKIWVQGALELEAIDVGALVHDCENRAKENTICEMLSYRTESVRRALGYRDESKSSWPLMLLIHSHSLVDIGPYNDSEIRDWLAKRFPATRQVSCKRLHQGQELTELCRKLGSYPFKDRVQFNHAFETDGYRSGAYLNDWQLARLVLAYENLCRGGFKSLLVGAKAKSWAMP